MLPKFLREELANCNIELMAKNFVCLIRFRNISAFLKLKTTEDNCVEQTKDSMSQKRKEVKEWKNMTLIALSTIAMVPEE